MEDGLGSTLAKTVSKVNMVRIASLLALVLLWESMSLAGLLPKLFFASPRQILEVLPSLLDIYSFNFLSTLVAYAQAMILATSLGTGIGLAIGLNLYFREMLNPIVGLGLVTPKVTLIPLFVLAFGTGQMTSVLFGALLGVFPIIVNTAAGVRETKTEYILLARAMGHSNMRIYHKVILTSSIPTFLTGLFLGSNLTMIGVLIAEMHHGLIGIGPLINQFSVNFRTPELYGAALLTIVVALLINGSFWYISRKLSNWRLT